MIMNSFIGPEHIVDLSLSFLSLLFANDFLGHGTQNSLELIFVFFFEALRPFVPFVQHLLRTTSGV